MTFGEKPTAIIKRNNLQQNSGNGDFYDIVDKACDELMDKQIKYSIRRIQEMKERLSVLECELDDFLGKNERN